MYMYVRIDAWDILTKKRKQHPPLGDNASTAEAAPGRVGRNDQCEARRANTTPSHGAHLELGHLRLKTWSKSDFSIAETTWPTYLVYIIIVVVVVLTLTRRYNPVRGHRTGSNNSGAEDYLMRKTNINRR